MHEYATCERKIMRSRNFDVVHIKTLCNFFYAMDTMIEVQNRFSKPLLIIVKETPDDGIVTDKRTVSGLFPDIIVRANINNPVLFPNIIEGAECLGEVCPIICFTPLCAKRRRPLRFR